MCETNSTFNASYIKHILIHWRLLFTYTFVIRCNIHLIFASEQINAHYTFDDDVHFLHPSDEAR